MKQLTSLSKESYKKLPKDGSSDIMIDKDKLESVGEYMNKKIKIIGYVLLTVVIAIVGYIIIHELGHMIVMLSAGATITDFSILKAHVIGVGGNYSYVSNLWLHANGALLPMVVSLIYTLFYRKKIKSLFYHIFSYFISIISIGSMFAWVVIPFIYMQGNAPAGDDVTKFLHKFTQEYHPLVVSAVAMLIIGLDVFVIIKKDIIKNFIRIIRE